MYRAHKFTPNYSQVNPYPIYEDMIAHTDSVLLPLGFIKEELGLSQDGGFMLYGYRNDNKNSGRPVFWLDSNMHGSEWWTCYYCLDFIEAVWGNKHHDKQVSQLIRNNFNLYYIPSMNPWGYENVKYYQSRGVNLNRNFDSRWELYGGNAQWEGNNYKGAAPESESETRHTVKKFNEIKPYIAINCHTTTGSGNGLDMNRRYKKYHLLTKDMQESFKITVPDAGTLEWNAQFSPSAQAWYGLQKSKENTDVIASILEHQSDTDKYNVGLTFLFIIALSTINYKNNGYLKLTNPYSLIRN